MAALRVAEELIQPRAPSLRVFWMQYPLEFTLAICAPDWLNVVSFMAMTIVLAKTLAEDSTSPRYDSAVVPIAKT